MDQCQGTVDISTIQVDEEDLEKYEFAVSLSSGSTTATEWDDSIPDEDFVSFVTRATPETILDDEKYLPIAYNYEKWLGGAIQRRITGDTF